MRLDVVVVGGGPAGLAHAFWRQQQQPSLRIAVIEAAPRLGGWIDTQQIDGYRCEAGPQGLRPNLDSDTLLAALGIEAEVEPCSTRAVRRWIGRAGSLELLPSGPGGLLRTKLLSWSGKLRLLTEPLRRTGGPPRESLAAFVSRRLGAQTAPLADAVASGIFAGTADQLEVASAFPTLQRLERDHGSLFAAMKAMRHTHRVKRPMLCSFRGGMTSFITHLHAAIGDAVETDSPLQAITPNDRVWRLEIGGPRHRSLDTRELVLAIPAHAAAQVLRKINGALADELDAIPFANVANIYLGFETAAVPQDLAGFGFLLPSTEQARILGAIYCSSILPDAAPAGRILVRLLAGGIQHPEVVDLPPNQLARIAEAEFRRYTGVTAATTFEHVAVARRAIPQYVAGHAERVQRIRDYTTALPGLSLIGNSYEQVSVVGQLGRPVALS